MNLTIKNYLKATLIIIIGLFISSFIINLLYYYDIISNNTIKYLKMFLSILFFFIGGVYIGKKTISKGYINGLKLSLIMILIFLLSGIIFNSLKLSILIYYLIVTACITFGSMIGINKKKN